MRSQRVSRTLLIAVVFSLLATKAFAQRELYLEEHDAKPYYFGITLSGSNTRFNADLHEYFLNQDSVMVAEPLNSGGFALGLLATARLTNRFEARFNPQLMFTERSLFYQLRYKDRELGEEVTKKVESVIVTFPVHLKFRSDRIGNFRVYMLGGGKLDYDLASNAKARMADDMVKIDKIDYGIEAGFGFNFYFKSFIFSPEIKISHGLRNLHARDANLKYSNVLDRLQSRMIMFSIHLEG
jgi:Outer membrane protein beta-barrel domain